ncbi:MAG TPA: HesA/MoeB/ThiF family protein [Gammaproteobacteria bacterium]|nr:HesA/MoeB/ThiF family protein [Gammaproteobacteria bacterium]
MALNLNDDQLSRYSRHLLLTEIDELGQKRLLDARIVLVGLGGLGSPAACYLAAAGVGQLVLCDHDKVDASNLQRQILFDHGDIGRPKVDAAAARIRALNPDVRPVPYPGRLGGATLIKAVANADLVVDGSDNFDTRLALSAACVAYRTPLVSGAVAGFSGQVTVFRHDLFPGPCYHCLYGTGESPRNSCAEGGIFAPLAGIIGATQAAEAIKTLLDIGESMSGRLLRLDGRNMRWREARLRPDPACQVCAGRGPKRCENP